MHDVDAVVGEDCLQIGIGDGDVPVLGDVRAAFGVEARTP
jgi:hypothetical protein